MIDVCRELQHLTPPDPTGPDRVWRRFQESRAPRRAASWWLPVLALTAAATAGLFVVWPESTRQVTLETQEQATAIRWSDQVDLAFTGRGVARGTAREVVIDWEAGTLKAEVEPDSGTDLVVRTEEGDIHVVGTMFTVRRDRLGVTTTVRRGKVAVTCRDGWAGELSPETGSHTCLPVRPALLLGRADALTDGGATAQEVVDTLDRGIDAAEVGSAVHAELLARRMQGRASLADVDGALADAHAYLATGHTGRTSEVQRFAGWLALNARGCTDAIEMLRPLAVGDPEAAVLLAECVRAGSPDEARSLLSDALDGALSDAFRARAQAALDALGDS